jgi:hypothetical protein
LYCGSRRTSKCRSPSCSELVEITVPVMWRQELITCRRSGWYTPTRTVLVRGQLVDRVGAVRGVLGARVVVCTVVGTPAAVTDRSLEAVRVPDEALPQPPRTMAARNSATAPFTALARFPDGTVLEHTDASAKVVTVRGRR